ncbi:MAG: type VI secretion protein [Firmicutes bacterium]|nr:type VI secretion protein [Bacillota bacterium]
MAIRINQVFPIRAIGPTMCLVGRDRFSAVLEAVPINFSLRSEVEQERLVNAYTAFLNGLNFPVEILVRSDYLRLDDYLGDIKSHEEDIEPHLRPSLGEYIEFLEETAHVHHLVRRRFYLILSWEGMDSRSRPLRRGEVLWEEAENELERRREIIAAGLRPLGVRVKLLQRDDLFRFIYASLGGRQGLPKGASWVWD